MIPRRLALLALVLLFATGAPAPTAAALRVVATVPDLAALTHEVAGDRARVVSLALPSQDPHFVDARPNLALELSRADLLVAVGLELEAGWLPNLHVGSRNPKIQTGARGHLDCSRLVRLLDAPAGPIERSMGDIHPGGNPHYLLDPRNAAAAARGIASRLSELDPAGAPTFLARADDFARRVEEARAGWERSLEPLRGANVVAYHRSFPYLAAWLGLNVVEHIEPRPGIPPTPGHVHHVLTTMREKGVRMVLQEQFYPQTSGRLVADRAGVPVVTVAGGTDFPAGQTYIQRLDQLVGQLRAAGGGP